MRILVATTNRDKLREISRVLADIDAQLISLGDVSPVAEPEETGRTFQENARLKATYYAAHAGDAADLVVAEDSGLVVDALDGEPGVRSARFLRPDASYGERFEEIFRRLDLRKDLPRSARFICAVAAVRDGAIVFETTGTVEGVIANEPRGSGGFGYDPIFFYPPYGCTLAEVDDQAKLRVAHRGEAFRQFAAWLRTGAAPTVAPEF